MKYGIISPWLRIFVNAIRFAIEKYLHLRKFSGFLANSSLLYLQTARSLYESFTVEFELARKHD